jgi:hypothetical protein
LPYISYIDTKIKIEGNDFETQEISVSSYNGEPLEITLRRSEESLSFKIRKILKQMANLFNSVF